MGNSDIILNCTVLEEEEEGRHIRRGIQTKVRNTCSGQTYM
jgi:hypothetical protein